MNIKNKTILCVFAHPDDESFGPGGTLALLSQDNHVELVCVTDGNDPGKPDDMTVVRKNELHAAAEILGIKQLHFFNYKDGNLCNSVYHKVAERLQKIVDAVKPDIIMTFELRGVSGHIDHMALAAISSFVFQRTDVVKELWYFCELDVVTQEFPQYFIFFPPGVPRKDVDLIVDVSKVWNTKLKAMRAHVSQRSDAEMLIDIMEKFPKEEHFLVTRKQP